MLHARGRTPRWVSVALQPALDSRDQAAGVVAIAAGHRHAARDREALNLVTARLLALAEASPVAMMVETAPGDVELANEAFCRLLGLESAPQSLSGLPVKEVLARAAEAAKQPRAPARSWSTASPRAPCGRCAAAGDAHGGARARPRSR